MKLKILKGFISDTDSAKWLVFRLDKSHTHLLDKLNKTLENEEISVTVDKWRNARSLTSNAYCWSLIHQIAIKLNRTDEEVYLDLLRSYGRKDYIAAPIEAEEILKRNYKIVEQIKECTINESKAMTFRLITGSSLYNSKEMSTFIEGIVYEAKQLSIETMTPQEIQNLINMQKESEG